MKLDRFEKGALTLLVGVLIFVVACVTHDLAILTQFWKDVTYWVMVFGAAVFLIGWGILLHAPILKERT
ncbi:MAG: hypothetical protein E6R05_05155 [Candidatus Moraniibacteriota bacterium]|nr:MAG: hypothetical protein E6R05_05155 [Candidatus Moranbacteria bacterium]